jgi:hypothetical protein
MLTAPTRKIDMRKSRPQLARWVSNHGISAVILPRVPVFVPSVNIGEAAAAPPASAPPAAVAEQPNFTVYFAFDSAKLDGPAKAIVQSLLAEKQQMQQAMQHLQLELKYKTQIEQGWMGVEREKAKLQTDTKAHDAVIRSHTELDKAHIGAQAKIVTAEIGAAGQLLNTNTEAAHDRAAAREIVEAGANAERTNGNSNA